MDTAQILASILIIFGLCITYAFFMAKNSSGLKIEYLRLKNEFSEVDEVEVALHQTEKTYKKLQHDYKVDIEKYHQLASLTQQYDVGIGTMDKETVTISRKNNELHQLEAELAKVKNTVKQMVRDKTACVCWMDKNVVVNDKKSEARKLFNREIKLRLRCFDNEVKAALELVDWNNVSRLCDRLQRACNEINDRGDSVKVVLTVEYSRLRIKELRLTFELNQLKADIKEQKSEDKRLQREAEREETRIKIAAEKATKERKRMESLVQKELAKLSKMTEEQKAELVEHQHELEILKLRENRAVSMAQQTRAGYVYVISNSMAFGSGVVKIGMTRRADPNDRVRELGDASVPDTFDVHGFYYSEDAPALESAMHAEFSVHRVNLVNKRKEFFFVEPGSVMSAIEKNPIITTKL